MKHTHRFALHLRRPQDPKMDGTGLRFETMEHGGEYPDTMPQAIKLVDAEGPSCIYVPIMQDGNWSTAKATSSTWRMKSMCSALPRNTSTDTEGLAPKVSRTGLSPRLLTQRDSELTGLRAEAKARPVSEAIWAGGYFCAMLISFATSSSVQGRRIWVMSIAPPEQMSPGRSKSEFVEKVPARPSWNNPRDSILRKNVKLAKLPLNLSTRLAQRGW
jgi:hypothetical protein